MELLDRYLQAVKKHLPWQRQDDIIAELRANLESQLEEKEAALGRPLTTAEAEEWIKQLGAPILVAAGYQPQHYLIGPAVFPIYWYVLKLACAWALIIYSIVCVVQILTGSNPGVDELFEAVLHAPGALMTTAVWVTLTFAAIEFAIAHSYVKFPTMVAPSAAWSPGGLPPLDSKLAAGKKPRSFAQAVVEAVFGFLFLAWLLLIPKHPWLLFGPGAPYLNASPYQLGPVWVQFYWWIVALNVLQVGWGCIDLLRGTWQKKRPVLRLAMKAFGLIPVVLLVTAPNQVTVLLKHPELDAARYGATLDTINLGINRAFLMILVIASLQLIWDIGRMSVDAWRRREAAMR
jgi:hypothetical protein